MLLSREVCAVMPVAYCPLPITNCHCLLTSPIAHCRRLTRAWFRSSLVAIFRLAIPCHLLCCYHFIHVVLDHVFAASLPLSLSLCHLIVDVVVAAMSSPYSCPTTIMSLPYHYHVFAISPSCLCHLTIMSLPYHHIFVMPCYCHHLILSCLVVVDLSRRRCDMCPSFNARTELAVAACHGFTFYSMFHLDQVISSSFSMHFILPFLPSTPFVIVIHQRQYLITDVGVGNCNLLERSILLWLSSRSVGEPGKLVIGLGRSWVKLVSLHPMRILTFPSRRLVKRWLWLPRSKNRCRIWSGSWG